MTDNSVSPHFLNHMTAASAAFEAEANEEIVAANAIKLLAKGSRIDASTCDRLLEHKLRKPLEVSVRVVGGVDATALAEAAEKVISRHGLLRSICADGRLPAVGDALVGLKLSPQLQTLLTVYGRHQPERLEHTVGVAMLALALALALARRLLPGESERHRALATAGLLHDVGELYIEPAWLGTQHRLNPLQWHHIATHPIVGHRVLLTVSGGGRLRRSPASAPPPSWSRVSSARRCSSCCIAWPRDMTTCSVPSPRPLPASKTQHSDWDM